MTGAPLVVLDACVLTAGRSRTLRQLLDILNGTVPDFASLVSDVIS
jgi:hypothetical protein